MPRTMFVFYVCVWVFFSGHDETFQKFRSLSLRHCNDLLHVINWASLKSPLQTAALASSTSVSEDGAPLGVTHNKLKEDGGSLSCGLCSFCRLAKGRRHIPSAHPPACHSRHLHSPRDVKSSLPELPSTLRAL